MDETRGGKLEVAGMIVAGGMPLTCRLPIAGKTEGRLLGIPIAGVTGRLPYKIDDTVPSADEALKRSPRLDTPVAVASIEPTTLFAAFIRSPTTFNSLSNAVTCSYQPQTRI